MHYLLMVVMIRRSGATRMALVSTLVLLCYEVPYGIASEAPDTEINSAWSRFQTAPLLPSLAEDPLEGNANVASSTCPSDLEFYLTEDIAAVSFDSSSKLTEIYVGRFNQNTVVRHSIDSLLNHSETNLPVAYGSVWDAADLDRDGNLELVLQRGDGSDGFLDIISAPLWQLRSRFVYPGMNVNMHARACEIDGDPYLEIYLVPHSFSSGRAVLIDYNPGLESFVEIANVAAPWATQGEPAIGDFDNDGRMEFISGNYDGYGVFEWRDGQLNYIGNIGEPYGGYSAIECRPKPDGMLRALAGYGYDTYRYQLFKPVADNTFELEFDFSKQTGYLGDHPCQAADVDCDGLDELIMVFPPVSESWEWDVDADSFLQDCNWQTSINEIAVAWYPMDLNQDGASEWGSINVPKLFQDFPGPRCLGCDPTGHCTPPAFPCVCACHADPACDGMTDVLDVVKTIDAAFRGSPQQNDPAPLCDAYQTDIDCSGSTDIIDVTRVINVTFRNASAAQEFCDPCVAVRDEEQARPSRFAQDKQ